MTPNNSNRVSILGFTDDQLNAYNSLIEFINDDYDENKDNRYALIGPAGTGKTYLVKALIKNCKLSYSTIKLAAPTHKAARILQNSINLPQVKVNTLQSDLGLKPNYDNQKFDINNPPFDPRGKIKINKEVKLYIVDEASMINRSLQMLLEKVCRKDKVKILYIGDASQLPPVNEYYSPALKAVNTCVLKQIVRQEEDNPIVPLLELLRNDVKNKTFTFLNYIAKNPEQFDNGNVKGYKVCNPKEFNDLVYTYFSDDALTKDVDFCKVIAYTNGCVETWNKFVRSVIIKDADTSILTKNDLLLGYTTIVNQFNEAVIKNSEEYIINDIANYTHPQYAFKGFLVRFTAIHGGNTSQPLFVLDYTDNYTMQSYLDMSNKLINAAKSASSGNRAQRWREYYEFKESCLLLTNILNPNRTIKYSRDIDYGFALTSHKSQGGTYDTVFVDVNDIVFDKYGHPYTNAEEINRRLYVACSRTKNKLYLKYGK